MSEEPTERVEGLEALDDAAEGIWARFAEGEWELACGECGRFLADCAWIDITATMALNAPNSAASEAIRKRMLATGVRSYRMEVALPAGEWQAMGRPKIWRRESPLRHHSRVSRRARVVGDYWSSASLGVAAVPPFFIECPSCRVVQQVGRYRRQGLPALEEKAS